MTIHEAVAILNERRHLERADWAVSLRDDWDDEVYSKSDVTICCSEFEAIAIAEKYQRESQPVAELDNDRCAVCGWRLAEDMALGCVRGNCSQRPAPERYYDPERAQRERGTVAKCATGK